MRRIDTDNAVISCDRLAVDDHRNMTAKFGGNGINRLEVGSSRLGCAEIGIRLGSKWLHHGFLCSPGRSPQGYAEGERSAILRQAPSTGRSGQQWVDHILRKSSAVRGQTADSDKVNDSILIVEDSASVRRLIEVCLRELSLNIVGAADGVAGLEAARETLPTAIVLDIGLPGMDGWEVLRRLRADDATRDTKVLILTAHAQPEVAVQAQEGGADDFMTKPFRPTDLRDRVAKMIAS